MLPVTPASRRYTAGTIPVDETEVIRLTDEDAHSQLLIAPAFGNNAYDFRVNGKPVMWSPYKTLAEALARPTYLGNPFLAPWANRIDGEVYDVNGNQYRLNSSLGNYRTDALHQPIHGLLAYSPRWRVTGLSRSDDGASATSRLEFWRYPDWMAQFPFAHSISMTYRLRNTTVEVQTTVENQCSEPLPLSLGYHPYFRLSDCPRDAWKVRIPATESIELSNLLVPTGKRVPMPYANPQPLAGTQLDDVFTSLVAGEGGHPEFVLEGIGEKITVTYGQRYPVAVVYAPAGGDFVCFEPMTAPTNVFNLFARGLWPQLQTVAPGGTWSESFWIRADGF